MPETYWGKAREFLSKHNLDVGDIIELEKNGIQVKGIIMPTYSNNDDIIVLKLDNGYNIGISVSNIQNVKLIEKKRKEEKRREGAVSTTNSEVMIISTGGTIVSKIEYETGAVRPALTPDEIIEFMPEIKEIARIDAEILFSILSENMKPEYWIKIAEEAKKALDKGNKGVVIAHGTDTMAYTSAALSFSFRKMTGPIVLVGSQRSSDRPSSDSSMNLLTSILVAKNAPFGEVVVNMHGESSDTYTLVHRGVKVRKMHTSRRDAFQSINDLPLAKVHYIDKKIEILSDNYRSKESENTLDAKFDNRVFLLKYYPGLSPDMVEHLISSGIRGIIIEGTGLGHTSSDFYEVFKKASKDGVFIGMTSQCLFGRVNMNVYTTGRLLQEAGVVPLEDMLPETALVKLMWTLAHENDLDRIKEIMLTNLAGEINYIHHYEMFPRWYHDRIRLQ
ncbi:Glu-tRNA(Gln) amidotransferase subunit GatD [Sulfolobus acidocaldarius]|uniref:Glutamyl-tRNA(Gln) amidotransferase subunit D n=4 Tax=Sulfolobus acidocaldarius TaxID=2285 RepID=GATD_SULAC|nr:Glu-tRNA(Gln) amidotransferase subunit GatD [Sulfolobus acidocaldarius]Q4J955.1 RecName: Full=Glutamyl-tRNA(Gln) amidotransferase subunit D; Short=Glu-ADT subunit D [Sulfolobus acidocaldarius DSM 639]AAY80684.1 glutamyl-tRNA(Gln) amidotransferase subunit D [Sulfolobus acidocaldarius DSM 639]AGE71281.1 glutamyl-tRNA(Gln) amidotransferase subunit D [Sulfolobus acidocaldarius N8]AGE73550.1 glutamyl-tRNA(Gln) amidotransferase subunit D [Sulfolobus acidocaldarius Ron12/I]ALU30458.1 glutamyl-tRNA